MSIKGFCSVLVFLIVFLLSLSVSVFSSEVQSSSSQTTNETGWYFLPAYPNYAPNGLPDFSQKQDNWKQHQSIWLFIGGLWSFCAPTSLADIFWWFDSKHEDTLGYPGDGNDSYPLVKNCNTVGAPIPGPLQDDHNFNNVNDVGSRWRNGRGAKELIEMLAWYCNTNFCRFPLVRGVPGTLAISLEKGVKQWIQDAGLQDQYAIEGRWNPEFSFIVDCVQNNSGVIVNLLLYNSHALVFQTFLGHYVAIAGIHRDGFIALSDPFQNEANPAPTPLEHNDASVVSHDIFPVNFTSPFPEKASWWIEEYFDFGITRFGGIGWYALIISEID